jgi:hypothetical protein
MSQYPYPYYDELEYPEYYNPEYFRRDPNQVNTEPVDYYPEYQEEYQEEYQKKEQKDYGKDYGKEPKAYKDEGDGDGYSDNKSKKSKKESDSEDEGEDIFFGAPGWSSTPIYRFVDLINDGTLEERAVNFDTHSPPKNQIIYIYECYLTENAVVFAVSDEDMQEEAISIVYPNGDKYIIYIPDQKLTKEDKRRLRNESHIEIDVSNKTTIDLYYAKEEVDRLNQILQCNNFRLSVDYVYYTQPNSTVFSYEFKINDVLLCLYDGEICVSSILLNIKSNRRYADIASRTSKVHEGNNLNKLLRAAAILVAPKIKPDLSYLISYAINPISVHLLVKYFDGEVQLLDHDKNAINEQSLYDLLPGYPPHMTLRDAQDIISEFRQVNIYMHLDPNHIAMAERVFRETAPKVRCDRGPGPGRRGGGGRTRRATHNHKKTKRRVKGWSGKRHTKRHSRK